MPSSAEPSLRTDAASRQSQSEMANIMARHHAATWKDSIPRAPLYILSFDSKRARAAFIAQCPKFVMPIDYATKEYLLRRGHQHRLVLWDESNPHDFRVVA
jgi:hypothetical protein